MNPKFQHLLVLIASAKELKCHSLSKDEQTIKKQAQFFAFIVFCVNICH